jgi:hypothetical protein
MNPNKKSNKAVWWLSDLGAVAALITFATLSTGAPTNSISGAQNTAAAVNAIEPVAAPTQLPVAEPQQQSQSVKVASPQATPEAGLSNDNYYVNSSGNTVQSPAYSNSVPAGASARCGDGTYSFSQSRRGTIAGKPVSYIYQLAAELGREIPRRIQKKRENARL